MDVLRRRDGGPAVMCPTALPRTRPARLTDGFTSGADPPLESLVTSTVDMLARQPFLAGLTDHQLGLLGPLASRSMFHAGNRIFSQGTPAEQFWLITDGSVYLDSEVPGYDNFVLETVGTGSVLGWSWLFPPYRWHFGAVAVTTTNTVTFDGALVRALCQRDPGLGYELTTRFLHVMGDRLQSARRRFEDCQRLSGHRGDV
jgi:CRP/FNR family transcriptional regulator, cyclic AMP receptor protein